MKVLLAAASWSWPWSPDVVAAVATCVTAFVALTGLGFISKQILDARKTFQGQTMLELILQFQDDEKARRARGLLFRDAYDKKLPLVDMFRQLTDYEPALHICSSAGLLRNQKMIPEDAVLNEFGGMIAKCWCAAEGIIRLRRKREHRDDLWAAFELLALDAINLERSKLTDDNELPFWIREYDEERKTIEQTVADALKELQKSKDIADAEFWAHRDREHFDPRP